MMKNRLELQIINGALSSFDSLKQLSMLSEKHFENILCQHSFSILQELFNEGKKPDITLFSAVYIDKYNESEFSSLYGELVTLDVTPSYNYKILLNQLEKRYFKKQIGLRLNDMTKKLKSGFVDIDVIANEITELTQGAKTNDDTGVNFSELPERYEFDSLFDGTYFRTTFAGLDEIINGYFRGQVITWAGRPGLGKSIAALQQAFQMSDNGIKCLLFSLEMSREEIISRRIQQKTKIPSWKIESKKLDSGEREKAVEVYKTFKKTHVHLYDDISNIGKIITTIRKHIINNSVDVVFIDYIQLVEGGEGHNKNERISSITRMLKNLARESKITIVLLAQLNRAVERENRMPYLADLRDSGSIEQDSDVVIFIHKEVREELLDDKFYLIIAKNRKGRQGTIENFYIDYEHLKYMFIDKAHETDEFKKQSSVDLYGGRYD